MISIRNQTHAIQVNRKIHNGVRGSLSRKFKQTHASFHRRDVAAQHILMNLVILMPLRFDGDRRHIGTLVNVLVDVLDSLVRRTHLHVDVAVELLRQVWVIRHNPLVDLRVIPYLPSCGSEFLLNDADVGRLGTCPQP